MGIPKVEHKVKFLLVSRRSDAARDIRNELSRLPNHEVDFQETARAALDVISRGDIDYLLFNFDHFNELQAKLVRDIRQLGHVFQIFVIAEIVDEDAANEVRRLKDILVVRRDTLDLNRDVSGICSRIHQGQEAYPRKTKRFTTSQRAQLKNIDNPCDISVYIGNLSHQGAYIEYVEFEKNPLQVADLVSMVVDLKKVGRRRTVYGKVMWIRAIKAHRFAAGIHFIKNELD